MSPNTTWHFAYGSNMHRQQIVQRSGSEPQDEKIARLENYELIFDKIARGGTGSANIAPAEGKTVWGVLYRLSEQQLRALDRFEGVPDHYRRVEVSVLDQENNKVPAQVYLARKVRKGLKPDRLYLQKIIQGAEQHALPSDYVGRLKKIPAV